LTSNGKMRRNKLGLLPNWCFDRQKHEEEIGENQGKQGYQTER